MELNRDQAEARRLLADLSAKGIELTGIHPDMSIGQDLGIDSLKFVRLVLEIETMVGRKLFDVQIIAGIKKVSDLYDVLNTP